MELFSVRMCDGDDIEVYADDYEIEVDEDSMNGDVVFLDEDGEEVGRVQHWAGVFRVAEMEDDEDEDLED